MNLLPGGEEEDTTDDDDDDKAGDVSVDEALVVEINDEDTEHEIYEAEDEETDEADDGMFDTSDSE
jgi:hypothetical protein